ncbi:MAG: hypothetical protein ACOYL6_08455 [Bacteriovoracaceae bacterium]
MKTLSFFLIFISASSMAATFKCEDEGGKEISCERSTDVAANLFSCGEKGEIEMSKGGAHLSYLDDEYARAIQDHWDSFDLSGYNNKSGVILCNMQADIPKN